MENSDDNRGANSLIRSICLLNSVWIVFPLCWLLWRPICPFRLGLAKQNYPFRRILGKDGILWERRSTIYLDTKAATEGFLQNICSRGMFQLEMVVCSKKNRKFVYLEITDLFLHKNLSPGNFRSVLK